MENNSYSASETKDRYDWVAILHLVQFLNLIIPGGGLIGAFAIWKMKGKESRKICTQGKEVVNFQIAVVLITVALGLLRVATFSAVIPEFSSEVVSLLMCIAFGVQIYFPVLAIAQISDGKEPRYPMIHKFVN